MPLFIRSFSLLSGQNDLPHAATLPYDGVRRCSGSLALNFILSRPVGQTPILPPSHALDVNHHRNDLPKSKFAVHPSRNIPCATRAAEERPRSIPGQCSAFDARLTTTFSAMLMLAPAFAAVRPLITRRGFSSSTSLHAAADFTHAIIGGGAVGLAIARRLQQKDGVSTVLIERHGSVGTETSSRNSEVWF